MCANGVKAIHHADEFEPDLILMSMPDMNGAEAAPILKRMMPRVPIIIFTIFEFGDTKGRRRRCCAIKAEGIDQLTDHLKRLADSSTAGMAS